MPRGGRDFGCEAKLAHPGSTPEMTQKIPECARAGPSHSSRASAGAYGTQYPRRAWSLEGRGIHREIPVETALAAGSSRRLVSTFGVLGERREHTIEAGRELPLHHE